MIHVRVFSVFTIGSHYHTVHAGILHHTKHFSPRGEVLELPDDRETVGHAFNQSSKRFQMYVRGYVR